MVLYGPERQQGAVAGICASWMTERTEEEALDQTTSSSRARVSQSLACTRTQLGCSRPARSLLVPLVPLMVASSRPVDGTPAAPPVPLDCREGTLGFFHTLERLKVRSGSF